MIRIVLDGMEDDPKPPHVQWPHCPLPGEPVEFNGAWYLVKTRKFAHEYSEDGPRIAAQIVTLVLTARPEGA